MTDDLITPVYNRPTRPPKVKQLTPAVVVAVDRPCDDEGCFESSGGSPDPDSVPDDPPSYRVEEEEENAVAVTESTVTVPSTTTTATTTRSPPTLQQLTTTTASTAWMVTPRPTINRVDQPSPQQQRNLRVQVTDYFKLNKSVSYLSARSMRRWDSEIGQFMHQFIEVQIIRMKNVTPGETVTKD